MAEIRSIDGGRKARAKTVAEARILECKCGSRRIRDEYVGRMVGKSGRVVHKGTKVAVCGQCGNIIE